MRSRVGTVKRVSLAATALAAGAAIVAVATGTVSIGTPFSGADEPATELVGAKSTAGDGYGNRGDLFVVTQDNRLYRFDKLGTGRQELNVAITGLAGGERLLGIDTRPANGQLYAVGSTGRLYVIDPISGAAGPVGAPFATALSGKRFGVDFNPTVDRLRIVSDTGQNLRIDPTTGAVAGVDTALSRKGVTAAGYTNSVAGATSTALYDIDSTKDSLVLQGTKPGVTPVVSPNTGMLFPVGRLGIDVVGLDGFDIVGAAKGATFREADYTALAAVRIKGGDGTRLVRVDLRSGRATAKAKLPGTVVGIAASAGAPVTVYATTARNDLVSFDRDTLRIRAQRPITGLASGEKVLGIDVRPANGQLYALGSTNQIYTVNPGTAAATAVGTPFSPAAYGNGVGLDVNPVVDRLRVVTSTGQNLRLVPDTGAVAGVDKPLAYAAGDRNAGTKPKVAHAAYTNNRAGTASTILYDVDTGTDALAVQNPPNDGTLRTTGKLKLNVDSAGGFDIAADGDAIAAFSRSGGSRIYSVNLTTGKARLIGKLGRGSVLTSLTVAPRGV
ncbi:hypothetical protein DMB66_41810 [Actinoplanes sp. ATCC 53533]|uniref:DUF4394 domain-containing protein n=1 Tax=Actinoplanes sp. ATCC 53533 TaxID=1288362 RepID=UPI000F7B4DE6|nr:DUF4394 domain-containing protein [Actinoplanes sp. ATCC 53533]RSM51499.1 hypothetical protein DMB66_41810 [Actinoplanes sp. ATCC 53533]